MFELDGASKTYGDDAALHPLDLRVESGKTTVLLGPSGSGKSTVLRLLVGLVVPDSGRVTFDATPVAGDTVLELRRRMGYVIQEGGLFPHLTARDNAALVARWLGWTVERIRARAAELAALVHLDVDLLDRHPQELSGGQRQRVALMRALMLDPDALLLDEPLGALDPMIRSDLQGDLREIFRTVGKTVVLVTHDLSEAAFFADHVVLLRDGRVVQEGPFEDLLERPADAFVTKFVQAQRAPAALQRGGAS